MRPRDLRVAERPEYPQYPGVVGGLAGVTERERGHWRSQEVTGGLLVPLTWVGSDTDPGTGRERSRPGR